MCDMATILDAFGCILLNNLYPGEGGRVIHMQDVLPQLYHQQGDGQDTGDGAQPADMEVYKARRLYHAYCFNQSRKGKS